MKLELGNFHQTLLPSMPARSVQRYNPEICQSHFSHFVINVHMDMNNLFVFKISTIFTPPLTTMGDTAKNLSEGQASISDRHTSSFACCRFGAVTAHGYIF